MTLTHNFEMPTNPRARPEPDHKLWIGTVVIHNRANLAKVSMLATPAGSRRRRNTKSDGFSKNGPSFGAAAPLMQVLFILHALFYLQIEKGKVDYSTVNTKLF